MRKESENGGGCNGVATRPRRLLPRFSLRRLLYSSPLLGRRFARAANSSNRTVKGYCLDSIEHENFNELENFKSIYSISIINYS